MTPLRVGLVGFGLAGRVFHGPLLDADPRFRIAAIVTGDPGRRSQAERLHPDATVVGDADAMLGMRLDLVVVASPPATHVPLAQRCLDAGLPVVVDKPFCPTAAQAEELCERADRLGLMLTVFQNRRWDSDFLTLQRLVESGALGDVRRFESRFERWKPADTKAWRVADPAEAGGVVYDLGTHLVDQAIHLFGPVVDMHGELTSHGGTAAPDDGFLSLLHAHGVRSHLFASSVVGQVGPRFRVLGSESAFTSWGLDVQETQLADGLRPGDAGYGVAAPDRWPTVGLDGATRRVEPSTGRYDAFYDGVARAVLEGAAPPVDPRDAVATIAVIEEAHRRFRS